MGMLRALGGSRRCRTSTTVAAAENSAPEPCFPPLARTGSRQPSDYGPPMTADMRQGPCVSCRRHDRHQDLRHETPRGDLLRPDVPHLVGWHPRGARPRRIHGRRGADRGAPSAGVPGDVRRPERGGHPDGGCRQWKSGISRPPLPIAQVAGGRPLVRGRAPDRAPRGDGGTAPALAQLRSVPPRRIRIRRQGVPHCDRSRGGTDDWHLRGTRLDGVRYPQPEAALRSPDHRAHRGPAVGVRGTSRSSRKAISSGRSP